MFKAFAMDFFVFLYIIYSICSIRKSLKQTLLLIQKKQLEVLCERRCSQKIRKIHKKTHVPETFLIKLQAKHRFYRTLPDECFYEFRNLVRILDKCEESAIWSINKADAKFEKKEGTCLKVLLQLLVIIFCHINCSCRFSWINNQVLLWYFPLECV